MNSQQILSKIPSLDPWESQKRLGGDARVVFDVGAHKGRTVGHYLELFPNATVYAFEPVNVALFQEYTPKLTDHRRIVLIQKAVLDYTGEIGFYVSAYSGVSGISRCIQLPDAEKVVVPCITLDDFCSQGIQYIDVLKIDTEGADLRVLRGARGLLERGKIGMIYCELRFHRFHKKQAPMWQICEFLDGYGFELYAFWAGRGKKQQVLQGNGLFAKC